MEENRSLIEWLTAIVGAWILVSVWLLPMIQPGINLSGTAQMNHLIVGGAVVVLALAGIFAYQIWEEWLLAGLGLWLVASPWILGFSDLGTFVLSDILVGLFLVATSGWLVFTDNAAA